MNLNLLQFLPKPLKLVCGHSDNDRECYEELFESKLSSSSPQCGRAVQSQDMHSELEMYASRLAEAEQRQRAMSTPDLGSEDEHSLIAQYCNSLHGNDYSRVLRSPMQIVMAMDVDQRTELQSMIYDLEEENRILQMEYDLLKQSRDCYDDLSTMPPAADYEVAGNHVSAHENVEVENSRDVEMLAEAKLLRQHKGRLESRMHMLEEHNQQLEWQLSRLRQLLDQPQTNGQILTYPMSATLSDTRANIMSSSPYAGLVQRRGPPSFSSVVCDSNRPDPECSANVDSLLQVAGEVDKAFSTLVNIITDDENSDDDASHPTKSFRH